MLTGRAGGRQLGPIVPSTLLRISLASKGQEGPAGAMRAKSWRSVRNGERGGARMFGIRMLFLLLSPDGIGRHKESLSFTGTLAKLGTGHTDAFPERHRLRRCTTLCGTSHTGRGTLVLLGSLVAMGPRPHTRNGRVLETSARTSRTRSGVPLRPIVTSAPCSVAKISSGTNENGRAKRRGLAWTRSPRKGARLRECAQNRRSFTPGLRLEIKAT